MPFVRRPVRLTGEDIPERPSASRRSQKEAQMELRAQFDVRVPVSAQWARLEQECARREPEKKINKARRDVDPNSAGSGNQAARLKKPKVSSPNQVSREREAREVKCHWERSERSTSSSRASCLLQGPV